MGFRFRRKFHRRGSRSLRNELAAQKRLLNSCVAGSRERAARSFRAEHGAHRQKTEAVRLQASPAIFDTARIFHGDAEHLKPPHIPAMGMPIFASRPQLSVKAALFKPRQIVKSLLGAGQDE